jgi:hypothetical protein
MKLNYCAAVLSLTLLSSYMLQPVYAASADDFTIDADGLPVGMPITGTFTMPPRDKDQLLSKPGHDADILAIMQLQGLYEYYHDANNGEGVASLFTQDGILEIPFNDGAGHLSPTGGTGGNGCAAFGPEQIAIFFNPATGPSASLNFPGHSHHVLTSIVVKVDDDGNTATLNANYIDDMVSNGVVTMFHPGEYINDFVRVGEHQWLFRHLRPLEDTMITTVNCTLSGQLPK